MGEETEHSPEVFPEQTGTWLIIMTAITIFLRKMVLEQLAINVKEKLYHNMHKNSRWLKDQNISEAYKSIRD